MKSNRFAHSLRPIQCLSCLLCSSLVFRAFTSHYFCFKQSIMLEWAFNNVIYIYPHNAKPSAPRSSVLTQTAVGVVISPLRTSLRISDNPGLMVLNSYISYVFSFLKQAFAGHWFLDNRILLSVWKICDLFLTSFPVRNDMDMSPVLVTIHTAG